MLHLLDVRDTLDVERFVQAHFDPTVEARSGAVTVKQGTQDASSQGAIGLIPPPTLPTEGWADIDASTFRVRGPTYNLDKVKTISAPALFKLVAIDLFEVNEPTQNICAHPRNRVTIAAERRDPAWIFAMNIMVPGPPYLSFVAYFQGDKVCTLCYSSNPHPIFYTLLH